jgi:hypothetical protein
MPQPVSEEATKPELFDFIPEYPRQLSLLARLSLWFSGGMFLDFGLLLGFAGLIPVLMLTWGDNIGQMMSAGGVLGSLGGLMMLVMFLLIFPVLGLSLVGYSLWCGRKNLSLMENGEIAQAVFDREIQTTIKIDRQKLVKLIYRFETPNGESHETTTYTTDPDGFWSGVRKKLVFYDPDAPTHNLLWDKLTCMKPRPVFFDEVLQSFHGSIGRVVFSLCFTVILLIELVLCCRNLSVGIQILLGGQ